ncbi:EI24 domain-containing protein [Pelagibius sp.]|uniref:EI24 domain-containing protein n=1 Tax=Pelagibius sp. TaxID=1931238 RepID=UPI00262ABC7C|nr:EI24 domain-containing protein [Pelagibius sp.]
MFQALSRAVRQSFDPAFRSVFNRSLLFSLVTFIAVWLVSWFALDWAGAWLVAWMRDWAGEGFWVGLLEWLVDIAAIGAIAVASFFLFPAVMVSIMALLLEEIAAAVERRHYPELPPARAQPVSEAILGNLIFVAATLILNLLVLPLYLILIWIPPLNLVLFYLLNGYLLGREYFELVSVRRLALPESRSLRRRFRGKVILAGVVITFLLTIPLVNLVTPIVATAFMLHVFEDLRRQAA